MRRSSWSRRNVMKAAGAVMLPSAGSAPASLRLSLGNWTVGPRGLPAFRYTGPLKFGDAPDLPDDPWFLLGNHRLTLFAHASGRLRLLSGEHGWAATNGRAGRNAATLTVRGKAIALIGMDTPAAAAAEKTFGVGAVTYRYRPADGIEVSRTIALLPSHEIGAGPAAVLVTVEIANRARAAREIGYSETLAGDYQPILPPWSHDAAQIVIDRSDVTDAPRNLARVDATLTGKAPLAVRAHPHMSRFDAEPPSLWLAGLDEMRASVEQHVLTAEAALRLEAGAVRRLQFVFGHAFAAEAGGIRETVDALAAAAAQDGQFAEDWRAIVPAFADERDPVLRREMQWNAATLEAMATWRGYYDETVIPQGTTYDYEWGMLASSRDVAQHALPLCRLRPALARSVIRYIFKRMVADGEIKLNDEGYGWAAHGPMLTSDQQLFLFQLVAEYLGVTHDYALLDEDVGYYPLENGGLGTGLDHLTQAFLFLRDRVGTGTHGLIRLWNSDFNDLFYYWPTARPYNELFAESESHMNSAMAVVILADLARALRAAARPAADALAQAVELYRAQQLVAFTADLGDRAFARRAYRGQAGAVGEDSMWLEPQGFALQIRELGAPRRRALFGEISRRLIAGEAQGPRQIERGSAQGALKLGQRENGGFWYALTGPVVLGLIDLDADLAMSLVKAMGFTHFARRFPQYWTGLWTASDSLDASTVPSEGRSAMAPWCAHAHAWPLYCYLRIRDGHSGA